MAIALKLVNAIEWQNMATAELPKLLVLVSYLPGSRHGGGVVLDEILQRYPKDGYVCFSINPSDQRERPAELPESLRGIPCVTGALVPPLQWRGYRFYLPLLRALAFHALAPFRIRQAIAFGRKHRVEMVWAELQGDAVVIAQKVADGLGVPLVGTIWDDPEGWLADGGYDRLSRQLIWKRFQEALRRARHLSTAGEAMQQAYEELYGVKSVILRHGFEGSLLPLAPTKSQKDILIGFVGNVYGHEAFLAFFSALARLNSEGQVPPIKLLAFGGGRLLQVPGVEIETMGWQPAEVMLRQLAQTDFCYLPYWFDPSKRRHAELSFPNKFETYLAAGRPVLFHGPEYSGIAATIKQYRVGLCMHSLAPEEITRTIERLILDQPLRESLSQAAVAAFQAEFNAGVMMKNFLSLIQDRPNEDR